MCGVRSQTAAAHLQGAAGLSHQDSASASRRKKMNQLGDFEAGKLSFSTRLNLEQRPPGRKAQ